ncbi:MAG: ATP-binding protein [Bacteriovoracaceae bacterium]|jgi:signal transduction histidine kinase
MTNNYLKDQLRLLIFNRGHTTTWPNIVLAIISMLILHKMFENSIWNISGLTLVILGTIYRAFLLKRSNPKIERTWLSLHYAVSIIGFGWGLNYLLVHFYFGLESNQSLYNLLILVGLLSGAVTTLSPSPRLYQLYIISALILPIIHFSVDYNEPGHLVMALLMVTFSLFHFKQASLSYQIIKTSILNDQNLQEQMDKLQTLINAVPGFVSFIDDELRYKNINEFGKSFYKESEIIGKSVGHIHPHSEYSRFVHQFMESKKLNQTAEMEIEIGEKKSWFIITIKKIETFPKGAVIVSVPIDELVEMRKDLEAQQAKAHYSAKLASLGEMAASIAHEINNPLAIIQGSAEQLMRGYEKESITKERQEQSVKKIIGTTERISKIVRSLKTLSRNGDKDPFKDFYLKDVIDDCLEITRQNLQEKKIKLIVTPIIPDLKIFGQQVQISQVLMNLINNAYHAIENSPDEKWIRIELNKYDHYIELHISDSGAGIPEVIREKIMEPFFTTKDVGKGTGLGLSISKAIIENHGGTLKLDEEAKNTTFTITLPVSVKDKIS